MATLSLRIHIVKSNNVKMMQFDESMIIYDACRIIRERIPDAAQGQANEFGLFKPDEDPKMGRWLEMGRTLEYYHLKNGDVLEYRIKQRPLRVKTLDGSIKTVLVDDSQNVSELIKTVCAKIGLSNQEEFSFITEEELNRPTRKPGLNQKKMDAMKKQLHTDDTFNWLNPEKSLREQGVDETQVLVLR
jgi:talin